MGQATTLLPYITPTNPHHKFPYQSLALPVGSLLCGFPAAIDPLNLPKPICTHHSAKHVPKAHSDTHTSALAYRYCLITPCYHICTVSLE